MLRGLLGALVLVVLLVAPARADDTAPAPEPGHPWFGPALDIHADTPSAYAGRLGVDPSLYTFPVDYPLTTEGVDQLHRFAAEMSEQGAVLVLQVEPTVPLGDLAAGDATDLGDLVAGLAADPGVRTLVRFAPEMNGSWRAWGQQPESYVAAFRQVADAVHAAEPSASMVWSPVYGSGYPFRKQTGADSEIDLSGSRQVAPLDTDGNGRLDEGDDPYGPYYPGDDAVDWVGLFLYRFGQSQGITRNVLPPPGELADRLAERWGYPGNGRSSFYDRFAAGHDKPLLLETSALYNPSVGGVTDLALKRRWWREVLASLPAHPLIGGISWLELSREEPEVADEPVDWRVTAPPAVATAFRADLERSRVVLGPVTPVTTPTAEPSSTAGPSTSRLQRLVSGAVAGDAAARVAALVLALALAGALLGSRRPAWAYADDTERDVRVDLLRGALLVGMVALHLPVAGPLRDLARGATALGGLETFVLVSGLCVGLVYPTLAARLGQTAAVGRRFRRALITWIATLATVVAIYVLGLLPGLDPDAVDGLGLYDGARRLFDYPPPGWIARDLLWLQLGTWILLPIALFVALQLLSPLAAGPVQRGWWWAVLPLSWVLYAVGRWSGADLLPSYSEDIAPLLVWQVLFVHGIALGHHRRSVARWLRRPAGAAALAASVAAAGAVLWTGTATGTTADLPLPRLLVVGAAAVTALAVLTTCWRPTAAATGAVLLPLGRAPLLVVLLQAVAALLITWVPDLDHRWVGTVATVAVLGVLVVLTRSRTPEREPERQTVHA